MKLPQHTSTWGIKGSLCAGTRLVDMTAQELVDLIERILIEREERQ